MSIPLILITLFAVIGITSAIITKQKDGPIEEMSERVIEEETEKLLWLPDDSLEGRIDLTPMSKEVPNNYSPAKLSKSP